MLTRVTSHEFGGLSARERWRLAHRDARIWVTRPLLSGEDSVAKVADFGPREDWTDWLASGPASPYARGHEG